MYGRDRDAGQRRVAFAAAPGTWRCAARCRTACCATASPVTPNRFAVPDDSQRRRAVRQPVGLHASAVVTPSIAETRLAMCSSQDDPALPLGLVVALHPHLDRHQHPDRFFLADLHRRARSRDAARCGPRPPAPGPCGRAAAPRSAGRAGTCRRCSRRASRRSAGGRWGRSGSRRRRRPAPARRAACASGAIAFVVSGLSSAFGPARM